MKNKTGAQGKQSRSPEIINVVDIVKFEIESVKANRWMTDEEKKIKIGKLKLLAPRYEFDD